MLLGSVVITYLTEDNGVLDRSSKNAGEGICKFQMILSKNRVKEVLEEMHNGVGGGHSGINNVLVAVRDRFHWIRYRSDV